VLKINEKVPEFVNEHKGQLCPVNWEPGAKDMKPGLDLVGKI
jgi:alkyl hydroperoxide reductase subunit AhpC